MHYKTVIALLFLNPTFQVSVDLFANIKVYLLFAGRRYHSCTEILGSQFFEQKSNETLNLISQHLLYHGMFHDFIIL